MSQPLFSVVTVTLNCAEAACQTARSVLAQDFDDYEYLVKDGQSVDETTKRLRALGVQRVEVSPDGGIYEAMNQALGLCQGRYVWFLNAGDIFTTPTVLSEFARHLDGLEYPAFVYGDLESLDRHPFWQPAGATGSRQIRHRERLSRFYLYRRTVCHQVWAVERALYQRCGGLEARLRYVADYDFLLKAILRLRATYARVPCVCVTYAGGGFSEVNFERARAEAQQVLKRYYPFWERATYEALSRAARLVVHRRWFGRLHGRLPLGWRARLAGF